MKLQQISFAFKLISNNFLREKYMSKLNTKEETNVHEAKTLENFKYEPILRTKGLINRKL